MKRKSRSKNRKRKSKSPVKDGTKVGRFSVKSVTNINNFVSSELKNITRDAKMKYIFDIDFTQEKEFQDILKSENISFIKVKLNKYIDVVKKSTLYPKKQTENFRQNYLKKLLNLKERLNDIIYLPQKYSRKHKKPLNTTLSPINENEEDEYSLPVMRQSSYEEDPYLENGKLMYKHKKDSHKKRYYWKNDRYFDIEDTLS